MIKTDLGFYFNLMTEISKYKSASILIFGIVPYLSLFKVETSKYLWDNFPSYAHTLAKNKKYDEVVQSSRMRIKFFDDTVKRVDGTFELLDWIKRFHESHINQHKGLLGLLKRALQDDLGIFFYNGHVIGSTHTGLFNLGFEEKQFPITSKENFKVLGELSKSVGTEIGEYFGQLTQFHEFALSSLNSHFVYNIQDNNLKYKDEKSRRFLARIFNGDKAEELNLSLLLLLTTVNFFQLIFNQLTDGSPSTMFKMKFVLLYHLASSLSKLQNYYYPKSLLTGQSKEFFKAILKDSDLRNLSRKSKFRNNMVHYRIENLPTEKLSFDKKLYGLVEYYFEGQSYDEVNQTLNVQIKRVAKLLEEWLDLHVLPNTLSNW